MLKNTSKMPETVLMEISKFIGDNYTNSQIDMCFRQLSLSARGADSTKWKKVLFVLQKYQDKNNTSKDTIRVLENLMAPVRYIQDEKDYKDKKLQLNKILSMAGVELDETGTIVYVDVTKTIKEANERYSSLIQKLRNRNIHPQVMNYCTEELLADNYFHSVFEAAKSLSDRVRTISGLMEDGSELYNKAFSVKNPILKYNDLLTDSEINQQNGLKEMLHGITHYIRNVTAHEPKIKWIIDETAAIEILTVISYLHSEIDKCWKV